MKCTSVCLSNDFNFKQAWQYLQDHYKTAAYKNVIHIDEKEWDAFVFSYGLVVFWNADYDSQKSLLNQLYRFETAHVENDYEDSFEYSIGDVEASKIRNDEIFLAADDVLDKLAISHAISQSTSLTYFEDRIQKMIEKTRHIPLDLAKNGKISFSGKKISKLVGAMLQEKTLVNLHVDLLDTPEFFWEHPELEQLYFTTSRYLDIQNRVEVLNKKLEVISDILSVLSDEQKHHHSSTLEWIVIILILIEITFTLLEVFQIIHI